MIAASGTEIPYTHDLSFLLEIAGEQDAAVPQTVANAKWLTPWAVAMRYGTVEARLDRTAAVAVATDAVEWAATFTGAGPG